MLKANKKELELLEARQGVLRNNQLEIKKYVTYA
jgi:hypothetical protein